MRLSHAIFIGIVFVVCALGEGAASAYPQFQFSTGNTRCSLCHISPSGGGLLNSYGRSESADTISLGGRGNGDFLYGVYEEPDWLKFGMDFRAAGVFRKQGSASESLWFPMLGDTYAYLKLPKHLSLYASVGPRAQARGPGIDPAWSRIGSREHYAMWRPKSLGHVLRVGRFLMPFGIRSQDHTLYVRRNLGLYAWDETYNASYAYLGSDWETHVTIYTPAPDFLQVGDDFGDTGGAFTYERHLGAEPNSSLAAQLRLGRSSTHRQGIVGAVAKHYMPGLKTLVLSEIDLVVEDLLGAGPTRTQLVSYFGLTYTPVQGVMLGVAHETWNPDLAIEDNERRGLSANIQFFPWAKWELHLLGKLEFQGGVSDRIELGMLQLHYYL